MTLQVEENEYFQGILKTINNGETVMNSNDIKKIVMDFLRDSGLNEVTNDFALRPDLVGMKMFDEPLIGFCRANDACIQGYVNDRNLEDRKSFTQIEPPEFWLPGAKSIVSIFAPFTEQVRVSNRGGSDPSVEIRHARIEGQQFLNALAKHLVDTIIAAGYDGVAPSIDARINMKYEMFDKSVKSGKHYSSSWSERHVAYAAGLGTFSLSDSFISEKGAAGRATSVITTLELADEDYAPEAKKGVYENCTKCGACIRNCPVDAISLESGHDQGICEIFVDESMQKYRPYYGCAKCQTNVPCEACVPK